MRPASCVSSQAGLVGLLGLSTWMVLARIQGLWAPEFALLAVLSCGVPVILWSIFIDKVHRRATTGLGWQRQRSLRHSWRLSAVKLIGFWAVWAGLAVLYCAFRWHWREPFLFAMEVLRWALPGLVILSVPYVVWLDRYMDEPKDGAWHFGAWLCGLAGCASETIWSFLRGWAIKGFFLAFMLSILPGAYGIVVGRTWSDVAASPFSLTIWLISLMFVIDIMFGTIGYLLTFRPLDAHIRSAEPRLAGWVAALICYPPFVLIGENRIFDAKVATFGEENWVHWLPNSPHVQAIWGGLLVCLTAIYAWSTMAFGPRFSNLTHRGIITHGPYALSKHPAYLSKVTFWWMSGLPFLVTSGKLSDIVRNCVAMVGISAIYYWRAKTEEQHLSADPVYREYQAWIATHGLIARLLAWCRT